MQLIRLVFGADRAKAGEHMAGHMAWLQKGFDEGAFLASGSLANGQGGFVLGKGEGLAERVQDDPFVQHGIVQVEVEPLAAGRLAPGLARLLEQA